MQGGTQHRRDQHALLTGHCECRVDGNQGDAERVQGIDAVRQKNEWWVENNVVHSATTEGPFVGPDDKFAVYFNYDITFTPTGARNQMEEMALYTVQDGKIVREQFFYRTS